MPASNYLRTKLIDEALRNVNYVPPAQVYVGLNTADPTAAGNNTEATGAWYARQPVTFNAQSTPGVTDHEGEVQFSPVVGPNVTITHLTIWDAPTGGNMMLFNPVTTPKTFTEGDIPTFLDGEIVVSAT